ncbi:GntR family transcriptional regulator [Burkholderia plantarii]|uniref:GntR family transcriptional regulator n=1 Tax=Burkholderia plantarii TaxID=41899 RepID=UPI0006D89464|nr:GntR family transcriptional regulator [Burkholderia plantarii]ALK32572.1 Transcriptional regulator, GntR family [Burkholderia plantarii]WLE61653.1 GntR family transcriptional regulator [Burkholderia plantarii]GLZ19945.1 GntR family transcriptional regulator [Burkholderia plantarii]
MQNKRPGLGHMTRAEAAADELRRRILAGDIAEGTQLKQDALAAEFGISRIPLREALVQLESEGLVRILPHKGAIVAEFSIDEITELFELRALLEPMLLRKSVPHLVADDFAAIQQVLDAFSDELHANAPARWGELNTQLHQLLLSRANQPRTASIVHSLLQQTDRHTRVQLSLTAQSADRAEREHAELVELCRQRDAERAAALLKAHIEHVGDELKRFLESRRGA